MDYRRTEMNNRRLEMDYWHSEMSYWCLEMDYLRSEMNIQTLKCCKEHYFYKTSPTKND